MLLSAQKMINVLGLLMGAFLLTVPALAEEAEAPEGLPDQQVAENAVATAHPLATRAALDILAAGGNAFDAAVAATAALAVVEPYGSGLGGGGFYLLHEAAEQRDVMLDAREKAPLQASPDMFLNSAGEVDRDKAITGPLSAGIPGIPAALGVLAERYGRLPLAQSLAPAIALAKQGFEVDKRLLVVLGFRRSAIARSEAAAKVFLPEGELPVSGDTLIQLDLAETLEMLAKQGTDAFYQGEYARRLVDGVRKAGGIWQQDDLSQYRVLERDPVVGEYQGMKIVSAALPSSGGIALVEMMNILSNYELPGRGEPGRIHLIVEAMRRAYRDRAQWMGDPGYVDVPVERLLHPFYAQGLAASIRRGRATPSQLLPGVQTPKGGEDTTHFSILDSEGNRVAATLSINYPFGSGFMVEGTGVLLNDEMDDFVASPGQPNVYGLVGGAANAIEPGKRMLSSMSPTFLEYDDKVAIVGTPGGSRIITMVLHAALAFRDGLSASEIVALPRYHHQFLPDQIQYESAALGRNTRFELQWLGHELKEMGRQYGNMQMIVWDKESGQVEAASDPRGIGKADLGSYTD